MHHQHRGDRQRGVALVAVLGVVSLLIVLAVGALEATRRHGQLAHRSFEVVQASELADSAIRVAILEISAPGTARAGSTMPNPLSVRMFGQPIAVQIESEARRVDLNTADESVLAEQLVKGGMESSEARVLAARIVDWRDADDAPGAHGAERLEYRRADRSGGPRNGAFETISELRQVLGAQALAEPLLDSFTVYSHAHEARHADETAQGTFDAGALAGEAMRLLACATVEKTSICRVAILRFTGSRAQPALIYSWSTRYGT